MSTFEPSGDDVRTYAQSAGVGLEEGAEAPEPQEAETQGEAGVEAPDQQVAEEQAQEVLYEVKPDGQPEKVTLDELVQGYERRASFTRKSQQLAAERAAFDAERAASLANRSPGLGQPPSGVYDPWAFSAAAPAVVQSPHGSAEQAAAGITGGEYPARSASAYAADEDTGPGAILAEQQRIAAETRAMLQKNRDLVERMEKARIEQVAMGNLQMRYQDFNEERCMEQFYRLPHAEQLRYRAMPRSVAMELIHLQTRQNQAPQAQSRRESKPPKVPYSEPSRNVPTQGTRSAATQEAPPTSDRRALGEWWLEATGVPPPRR